jgi:hypothetical protein
VRSGGAAIIASSTDEKKPPGRRRRESVLPLTPIQALVSKKIKMGRIKKDLTKYGGFDKK